METAKKIYQNIQDGSLDLNAAESGVQHKPSQSGAVRSVINTGQGETSSSWKSRILGFNFDLQEKARGRRTVDAELKCRAGVSTRVDRSFANIHQESDW